MAKTVRTAPPKPQTWQPIKKFPQPAPNPPPAAHPTVRSSNEVAAHAVRVASEPGGIDPRQMHN
jgi:hypothetical protein